VEASNWLDNHPAAPLQWMNRRRRVLLGLAILGLAFLYLWCIAGDLFSLGVDEGIYLEGGRRVAAGQVVYRDFFVLTGPLTFWIEGALAHLGGNDIPFMRLALLADLAFLASAVYWLAAQFESEWFSAGLTFVFLVFESKVQHIVVKHRWDSAALATAAVVAAVSASRRNSRGLWMLAGALGASAAWATPSVGLVLVPLLVWAARRRIAAALACLGGVAAVSAAAAGYLASTHALGPMIEAMRWTAANYAGANALAYGATGISGGAAAAGVWQQAVRIVALAFETLPAILPLVALAGWTWRLARRKDTAETRDMAPLLAVMVALVFTAWPRWSSIQLLFVAAVPFTLCGILLHRSMDPRRRPGLYGALLLLALVSGVQRTAAAFERSGFSTRAGYMHGSSDDVEFLEQLERRIQPGDSLFVFPYLPVLYPLLDAHNPTRFLYLQPGMMTAEDEREAIKEVAAGKPHWVIVAEINQQTVLAAWPHSDPARIPMEAMHLYLRTHYRQVDQVNGKWGTMEVLERIGE
jgi:hypothetical protein